MNSTPFKKNYFFLSENYISSNLWKLTKYKLYKISINFYLSILLFTDFIPETPLVKNSSASSVETAGKTIVMESPTTQSTPYCNKLSSEIKHFTSPSSPIEFSPILMKVRIERKFFFFSFLVILNITLL